MANDGTVTTYFSGDTSDLRRAARDASKEVQRVSKAADAASTSAARSSAKAVSGILRMVETGKVTTKSLDKVGKSVGNVVSSVSGLAGGIGVALGLGALPALSDAAAGAVSRIKEQMKGLKTEVREAATAQRDWASAQLASIGSADSVRLAQLNLADATQKANDVRASGKATAAEIERAEIAQRNAIIDVASAQNAQSDAAVKAADSQKSFNKQVQDVIEKSKVYKRGNTGATILDQAESAKKAAAAFRGMASDTQGLTQDQRAFLRSIADSIAKAKEVPKKVTMKVDTPGLSPAISNLVAAKQRADALDGRRITITTVMDTITETHRLGNARGAFIGGTPNTRDDIPVNVSQGEAILNPRQIDMVGRDRVMGALAATGANRIRPGGSYAGGGVQASLDRAKDRFGSVMAQDDLLLARAESTSTFADDASVLRREQGHIKARIRAIQRRRRKGHLSRSQRQDLNEEEASLVRQLTDIGGQLNPPADAGGGSESDPFADQRARDAGFAAGLGRAIGYVFGGSGDIGSGGGGSAIKSAGALHVDKLVISNSPQNQATVAATGNTGNALLNRGRTYTAKTGVAF